MKKPKQLRFSSIGQLVENVSIYHKAYKQRTKILSNWLKDNNVPHRVFEDEIELDWDVIHEDLVKPYLTQLRIQGNNLKIIEALLHISDYESVRKNSRLPATGEHLNAD
jgi:hypothetical protein